MKQLASVRTLDGAQPLAYSVDGARSASGIGRSRLYVAIKNGDLPIRKLGKRTLILAKDLQKFLEGLPKAAA